MSHHNNSYAGVDIAKQKFDVALSNHPTVYSIPYSDKGIEQLLSLLRKFKTELICMEATGGMQRVLHKELHKHQFDVSIVNPRQIRDFARATGQLAKTDAIDAKIIAQFAETLKPKKTVPLDKNRQKIVDLTARRRQLTKMITQEKNRLSSTYDSDICKMIQKMIDQMSKQLIKVDEKIDQLIAKDRVLQEKVELIESVPGLGSATSKLLVSELPELGKLNRKEIAKLVGVAPVNRDSGTLRGKRMTGGGRCTIRKGLYMPIVVAIQHNARIRKFYEHLLANGKKKMVALIACMRKLLTILNVMIREGKKWNENKIIT